MTSQQKLDKTFEDWLRAKQIDPKQLSKSHIELWRAEYDREKKPEVKIATPVR